MQALVALYREATTDQVARGRSWYPTMLAHCRRISRQTGVPLRRTVATMAITSSDAQLTSNVKWTRQACESGGNVLVGRYPNTMRRKYGPLLSGEVSPRVVCTGSKVSAFYRAILGDTDSVVLDRWALRAVGHRRNAVTPKQYSRIADAFRESAAVVGEDPRAFQAVVWIVLRERHERNGVAVRLVDIHEVRS